MVLVSYPLFFSPPFNDWGRIGVHAKGNHASKCIIQQCILLRFWPAVVLVFELQGVFNHFHQQALELALHFLFDTLTNGLTAKEFLVGVVDLWHDGLIAKNRHCQAQLICKVKKNKSKTKAKISNESRMCHIRTIAYFHHKRAYDEN
jgi:hypothetical protein